MKRIPLSQGAYLVPSLLSTANLFCGFYAVIRAIEGDYGRAAMAILLAALFDLLDGRVARLTKTESDFGVEYDSLVDLASFGLAPAVLLYMWSLHTYQRLGWVAAFLYFACGALRLARYNIQVDTVERKRFQGLPIPAAALTLATLVLLFEGQVAPLSMRGPLSLFVTFITAPLMVSRIRFRSFKDLDLRGHKAFSVLLISLGILVVIAMNPEIVPFLILVTYIVSGPFEELLLMIRRRKGRTWVPAGNKEGDLTP